jgi:hypothetical protein
MHVVPVHQRPRRGRSIQSLDAKEPSRVTQPSKEPSILKRQMHVPGKFFRVYVVVALIALAFSFTCKQNNGGCMIMGLWGVTGCQPWTMFLARMDPNGNFTPINVLIMSAVNTAVIYAIGAYQTRGKT